MKKKSLLTGKFPLFKKCLTFSFFLFITIVITSWSDQKTTALPVKPPASVPYADLIVQRCSISREELIKLFQDDIRRVIIQFENEGGLLKVFAYGYDKRSKKTTGPINITSITGAANQFKVPNGVVLGNLEFTRGQFKRLFNDGNTLNRHKRITQTKIQTVYLIPNTTDRTVNGKTVTYVTFRLSLTNSDIIIMANDPMDANPSPPARPCTNCDNFD